MNKKITRYDIMNSSSAKTFDSVGRNSVKTKMAYSAGLLYLRLYLNTRNEDMHTLQSIIKPLSTNKINVYELLDSFVAYLIT